jgi:hypothetical protein
LAVFLEALYCGQRRCSDEHKKQRDSPKGFVGAVTHFARHLNAKFIANPRHDEYQEGQQKRQKNRTLRERQGLEKMDDWHHGQTPGKMYLSII